MLALPLDELAPGVEGCSPSSSCAVLWVFEADALSSVPVGLL